MSLVVDTSVIISVITNEKNKPTLINLTQGQDLIAPLSLHWEVGNAFSAMFKRKILTLSLAEKALSYYLTIPIRMIEVDLYKSIEISSKYNIYAYDAYFIECARSQHTPLLTLAIKMTEIAKQMNIKTIKV